MLYLSLIVLIPLSAVFIAVSARAGATSGMWSPTPRVLASLRLSFGAAICGHDQRGFRFAGRLGAGALHVSGRRLVDAMVDLPFALPTAVAGIALTALYAPTAGSDAAAPWDQGGLHPTRCHRGTDVYRPAIRGTNAAAGARGPGQGGGTGTSAGASLTSTHHLIGSMGYMAPEQLEYAKGVGPSADLYAVGVVLFRSLMAGSSSSPRSFEAIMRADCQATAPRLLAHGRAAERPPRRVRGPRAVPRPRGRASRRPPRCSRVGGGLGRRRGAGARHRAARGRRGLRRGRVGEHPGDLVSASGARVDPSSSTPLAAVVRSLEKDSRTDLLPVRRIDGS